MADVQTTELLVVKWATPAEEALGMAKLAGAMVERRIAQPSEVAIVAPNAAWAENLLTACRMANVRATRLWPVEPGQAGRAVLAELDDLAANGGPDAPRGRTLIHRVGADAVPEFAHALLHLQGDESDGAAEQSYHGGGEGDLHVVSHGGDVTGGKSRQRGSHRDECTHQSQHRPQFGDRFGEGKIFVGGNFKVRDQLLNSGFVGSVVPHLPHIGRH